MSGVIIALSLAVIGLTGLLALTIYNYNKRFKTLEDIAAEHHKTISIYNDIYRDWNHIQKIAIDRQTVAANERQNMLASLENMFNIMKHNMNCINEITEHVCVTSGFCPLCRQFLDASDHLESCTYAKGKFNKNT